MYLVLWSREAIVERKDRIQTFGNIWYLSATSWNKKVANNVVFKPSIFEHLNAIWWIRRGVLNKAK